LVDYGMKIIYLSGIGEDHGRGSFWLVALLFLVFGILFGLAMLRIGYRMGVDDAQFPQHQLVKSLSRIFQQERVQIEDIKQDTQSGIDALAIRVGQLQSQLLRLDALGERLVDIGGLDEGEFSFETIPAIGGPEGKQSLNQPSAMPDLLSQVGKLEGTVEHRQQQLTLMEDLIMNSNLEDAVHPTGQPVRKGWISSYYGMRNDPFTGKRSKHKGIDFAGKKGSDVIAVAAGVVTWAGERKGYGNLVEINHGRGYITRYGHNSEILVEIGGRVKQGEVIAAMGSTGRSTGPHVHFEVVRNGKIVNPAKYIATKRTQG
jgi:murein DD-endopeptidase MepM/ murein hydrolase activator NlpD